MRAEFRIPASSSCRSTSALIPLALLTVSVPWAIWSVSALLTAGASQTVPFAVSAGTFLILGIGYAALHGIRNMLWISVPFILTVESLIVFMVVPVWRFATGADQIDSGYAHSMFLVLIGFTAFWVGSLVVMRPNNLQFVPQKEGTSERVKLACLGMLIVGIAGNLAMWRLGLFGYTADPMARTTFAGILEALVFISSFLGAALIVSAIEVFKKPSSGTLIKAILIISFLGSLSFGVISGMKSALIQPFIFVAIVYLAVKRRLPRAVILLPLFLVLAVYPFVQAYRENLSNGFSSQANTIGGMEQVLQKSFDDAFNTFGSRRSSQQDGSLQDATSRISYLTYVRDIIDLPDPSLLNGNEKLWQAPFYPFIPRFVWKNKPVQDKGSRLAQVLGSGNRSSAAITIIGDLYTMDGTSGVVIGMLIYGICIQLYMNWQGKSISESSLFFYVLILQVLPNLESDAVGLITSDIHNALVFGVMAYIIYGHSTTAIAWRPKRSFRTA